MELISHLIPLLLLLLVNFFQSTFSYVIVLNTNPTTTPNSITTINTTVEPIARIKLLEECGMQKKFQIVGGRYKRIIGGSVARFGEFPWQAYIKIGGSQCGGALINHYYVITAAHCVRKAELREITVYLGEYDTKDTGWLTEPLEKVSFTIIQKIIHPEFVYNPQQPFRFDIALLKLDRRVVYKDNILPVCLPSSSDRRIGNNANINSYSYLGKYGVVAGWGKMNNSRGKSQTNILQKATLPILSNNRECQDWYHSQNISVILNNDMFCAGHKDGRMDTCGGDSGSPLVILNEDEKWTHAGITSSGFGCGLDSQPGIYHNVSTSFTWIQRQIRKD